MCDHFHAEYKLPSGEQGELEGGFTGYPDGWEEMTIEQRWAWRRQSAIDWGMPPEATLQRFWLAG